MMDIAFVYPNLLWFLLLVPLIVALALMGRRRPTRARFWAGLALRVSLLTLLILALAGIQLRLRADTLTAIFVLDASDSVSAAEQARGEAMVRQAIETMPIGDKAAVIVFGQDALVERMASEERILPDLTSAPVTARTDVAGALQLALALFPDEGAKRLVLLSDGRENLGHAVAQAELAAAHGIELTYLPLRGPQGEIEVLVETLYAPADVRQGQGFDLTVVVHSTAPVGATLRVFGDGQLVHSQAVRLQTGVNRFRVPVDAAETGFRRFRAQIMPDADTRLQNNEVGAFTVVHGPPRVLLVEGQPGEGDNLARALRAAEMDVALTPPGELPTTLPELASFDAVVLANVPAAALPAGAMEALQVYVRDLGKGLLMTGGEDAFGAGGYLRTPLEETLPVDMDVRTKEQSPNLALVLVVDKSGSMGHSTGSGQAQVDVAKEAAMRAGGALGARDYLGVVAFDQAAYWVLKVQRLVGLITLEQNIAGVYASGSTNIGAGIESAYAALQTTEARLKHVIVLTDGYVNVGQGTVDLIALAGEMREQGITLSVVATGGDSADYLAEMALSGGGRCYPAVDILRVPDFILKETVKAVGRYIVEEPFYPLPSAPSPVLRGLDPASLPLLLGYNGATPKGTARVILGTPRGDPLLATWQYGLGRAAVWTSDLKEQWAADWLAWDGFPRFAAQLVGWTLPAPQVEGITAQAALKDDRAVVRVEASDEAGHPRNFLDVSATLIGPDLQKMEFELAQVGAGRYEALAALSQPGTYLVQVGVMEGDESLGGQTLGLVVPYSPEYKASGTNRTLLSELARLTGGGELPEPVAAFTHNLPTADRAREIWGALLLIAALLFPLDVALRRVMLGPQDFRKAIAWLQGRLPVRRERPAGRERALGQLFRARDRVRERRARTDGPPFTSPPPVVSPTRPAEPPSEPTLSAPSDGDSLARLREAKKRARRDR